MHPPPFTPTAAELALYQPRLPEATIPAPAAPAATPPPPPPRPPLAPCVLTAAELARLAIPPRPALLDRWLCEGDLGYIFAPRGVGKTWMAMALPAAISRRHPLGLWHAGDAITPAESSSSSSSSSFPDTTSTTTSPDTTTSSSAPPQAQAATSPDLDPPPDPAHVPVLYVDGEMSLHLTQYRSSGLQMQLGNVSYLHHEHLFNEQGSSLNIGDEEDRQRLTTLLTQHGYRVLILDNLSSLASGIDENKGMDYEPVSHWLLDLRRRHITVIVVHHAGRNGFMRGHTKREDACSWILELRDAKQEGEPGAKFVSHFSKPSRNTGDPLPDLLWHFTSTPEGTTEVKCELAMNSEYAQFLQHVNDGVTSQHDIAELMGRHKGTVSKWARKALDEGHICGSPRRLAPLPTSDTTPVKSRYHTDEEDDEDHDDDSPF